ncbi:MAG: 16S rRNA processing protein RimM [Clostridia bacterium]|nr:16S rRNA processing protein RimM [Clostridia bacterium]
MNRYFDIGKIVNVHGIKGEVKIYPYTDHIELFNSLNYLLIDDKKYHISNTRIHQQMVLTSIEGIINREDAMAFINKVVYIHREDGTKLENDSYYFVDLIGCEVFEEEKFLGKITEIIQTGSNDVYVVRDGNEEILIPALKKVVLNVDITNKKILVELPEGLIDHEII